MARIMVPIDHSDSSTRALVAAIDKCDKSKESGDSIHLVHFYSYFDHLNDEKNNGKLYLDQARNLCDLSGVCLDVNLL